MLSSLLKMNLSHRIKPGDSCTSQISATTTITGNKYIKGIWQGSAWGSDFKIKRRWYIW